MTSTELGIARSERSRRYRLGVMGGTFDPIHHGIPWQKADRHVSLAEDRYLMTVIATASNPQFSVSRVDIDREGNTYTVDTLKDLRAERGDDVDYFFITGADAVRQILTWRGADELFDLAHFVGVTRPGVPLTKKDLSHLPLNSVTLLEVPALAISSTDCRERTQQGMPIWYLVPDGIVQYIAKRGLYPAPDSGVPRDSH